MKRFISLMLALVMVLGIIPATAFSVFAEKAEAVNSEVEPVADNEEMESSAEGVIEGTDITWKFEKRRLEISGTGAMPDYGKNEKKPWSGKWV